MQKVNAFGVGVAAVVTVAAGVALAPGRAHAGALGGPQEAYGTVLAHSARLYQTTFRGGELARVTAVGGGDIDLFVYDENGHLMDSDTDLDGTPVCVFQPRWTGVFTIRVVNNEGYPVSYHLETN